MRVGVVVLAAGASTRLGEAKQLVLLGERTLLARAVMVAGEAGCGPVMVVLGAIRGDFVVGDVGFARVVMNERWREGMGSSLRVGVESIRDEVDGVVVMTCDQPAVTAAHLRALVAAGVEGETVASGYAGRRGVPAYFPASRFSELLAVTGDAGARELLGSAGVVELAGGELDVDTPETLAEARRIFG